MGRAAIVCIVAVLIGPPGHTEDRRVETVRVNCRDAPSPRARIVTQFDEGAVVSVARSTRYWRQIDHPRLCWINARYLGPPDPGGVARPALRPALPEIAQARGADRSLRRVSGAGF